MSKDTTVQTSFEELLAEIADPILKSIAQQNVHEDACFLTETFIKNKSTAGIELSQEQIAEVFEFFFTKATQLGKKLNEDIKLKFIEQINIPLYDKGTL